MVRQHIGNRMSFSTPELETTLAQAVQLILAYLQDHQGARTNVVNYHSAAELAETIKTNDASITT